MAAARFDAHEAPFFELDADYAETSIEPFDRLAFARELVARALPRTRVAVCRGARQVQVQTGRLWGEAPDLRWVMIAVPPSASRRAIVQAIAALGGKHPAYLLDVHFAEQSLADPI